MKIKLQIIILSLILISGCASRKTVTEGQVEADGAIVEDQADGSDEPNENQGKQKLKTANEVVSQLPANTSTQNEIEQIGRAHV